MYTVKTIYNKEEDLVAHTNNSIYTMMNIPLDCTLLNKDDIKIYLRYLFNKGPVVNINNIYVYKAADNIKLLDNDKNEYIKIESMGSTMFSTLDSVTVLLKYPLQLFNEHFKYNDNAIIDINDDCLIINIIDDPLHCVISRSYSLRIVPDIMAENGIIKILGFNAIFTEENNI